MARNYTQTKWGWPQGRGVSAKGFSVHGLEKSEWNIRPEESCGTLKELGAGNELATGCVDTCPKWVAGHHFHQFPSDLRTRQCCQCELVVKQLDYIQLHEEGLI